jgi:hypothetical protein
MSTTNETSAMTGEQSAGTVELLRLRSPAWKISTPSPVSAFRSKLPPRLVPRRLSLRRAWTSDFISLHKTLITKLGTQACVPTMCGLHITHLHGHGHGIGIRCARSRVHLIHSRACTCMRTVCRPAPPDSPTAHQTMHAARCHPGTASHTVPRYGRQRGSVHTADHMCTARSHIAPCRVGGRCK